MTTLVRASVFPIQQYPCAVPSNGGAVATCEVFCEPATLSRNWLTALVAATQLCIRISAFAAIVLWPWESAW